MSEVVTGRKQKILTALWALEMLEDDNKLEGQLSFYRSGYGKVTGVWKDKWTKPIEFRMKRTPSNDILEYRTDTTGWSNTRYGSPYDLLCGRDFKKGATKHKVVNLKVKEKEVEDVK